MRAEALAPLAEARDHARLGRERVPLRSRDQVPAREDRRRREPRGDVVAPPVVVRNGESAQEGPPGDRRRQRPGAVAVGGDARRGEGVVDELAVGWPAAVQQRHALERHALGIPAHQVAEGHEHLRVGARRRPGPRRRKNAGRSALLGTSVDGAARSIAPRQASDELVGLAVGDGVADGAHDHLHVGAPPERLDQLELGRPDPAREVDRDLPARLCRPPRCAPNLRRGRGEQLGPPDAIRERRAHASHDVDHVGSPGALSGQGVERHARDGYEVPVGARDRPQGRRLIQGAREVGGRLLGERGAHGLELDRRRARHPPAGRQPTLRQLRGEPHPRRTAEVRHPGRRRSEPATHRERQRAAVDHDGRRRERVGLLRLADSVRQDREGGIAVRVRRGPDRHRGHSTEGLSRRQ